MINKGTLAYGVCGSFCTLEESLHQAEILTGRGWRLLPVFSFCAAQTDTRFGKAADWLRRFEAVTGQTPLCTLPGVEPLGPKEMAAGLVIAPCTGSTLARLAAGLSETPVTLAAKSLLRVGCPVILAPSTNDGLGASARNLGDLCNRRNYYLVPLRQDDPAAKPTSLQSDFSLLADTVDMALQGRQLQPVVRG